MFVLQTAGLSFDGQGTHKCGGMVHHMQHTSAVALMYGTWAHFLPNNVFTRQDGYLRTAVKLLHTMRLQLPKLEKMVNTSDNYDECVSVGWCDRPMLLVHLVG
jgi:hypothetical protein